MGNDYPFNPCRWIGLTSLPLSWVIMAGPIWAAHAHGFDNTPWHGNMLIFSIFIGTLLTLFNFIAWCPDGTAIKEVPE